MKRYKLEKLSDKENETFSFIVADEDNPVLVETAGFVPLEVKFKRFEEAGIRAQYSASEFDSDDLKQLYLNPDFSISQYDDLETIQEKLMLRADYIEELRKSKVGDDERSEESPTLSVSSSEKSTITKSTSDNIENT